MRGGLHLSSWSPSLRARQQRAVHLSEPASMSILPTARPSCPRQAGQCFRVFHANLSHGAPRQRSGVGPTVSSTSSIVMVGSRSVNAHWAFSTEPEGTMRHRDCAGEYQCRLRLPSERERGETASGVQSLPKNPHVGALRSTTLLLIADLRCCRRGGRAGRCHGGARLHAAAQGAEEAGARGGRPRAQDAHHGGCAAAVIGHCLPDRHTCTNLMRPQSIHRRLKRNRFLSCCLSCVDLSRGQSDECSLTLIRCAT